MVEGIIEYGRFIIKGTINEGVSVGKLFSRGVRLGFGIYI